MSKDLIERALHGLNELGAALSEIKAKWEEIENLAERTRKANQDATFAESNLASLRAKTAEQQGLLEAATHQRQAKELELQGVNGQIAHSQQQLHEANGRLRTLREQLG
jgi:predicted  nucleic acid-binding Zn-ribbon protein